MVLLQIDLPEELDKALRIERIQRNDITKAETAVKIIEWYFFDGKKEAKHDKQKKA